MQFPLNKYGEVEVQNNELRYFIPIAYTEASDLGELEESYRKKGKELMDSPYYLFASNLEVVRNRFCFTFQLEEMKAFHYIRQFPFEEQLYYLRSLVEMAKNIEQTPILWDKNSLLVDLTDGKIKTFLFEFDKHPIHVSQDAVDGLKEMIILALTTLHRVLGKPRRIDFIDQREIVIRFAENILHGKSVSEIGRVVEDTILEIERQLEQEKKEQPKPSVFEAFKKSGTRKKKRLLLLNSQSGVSPRKNRIFRHHMKRKSRFGIINTCIFLLRHSLWSFSLETQQGHLIFPSLKKQKLNKNRQKSFHLTSSSVFTGRQLRETNKKR